MALFSIVNRNSGTSVDVFDVKPATINGKQTALFLVQNEYTNEFEYRIASDYTAGAKEGFVKNKISVGTYDELVSAIANSSYYIIEINQDFSIENTITISRELILYGNNHRLEFTGIKDGIVINSNGVKVQDIEVDMIGNDPGWEGHYGIQVYNSTNVTLDNIICNGEDGGILINGSTVTFEGIINLSGNQFGGIEVSQNSSGQISTLNIGRAILTNDTETYTHPTLWSDDLVSVINYGSQPLYKEIRNGQQLYYLEQSNTIEPDPEG